MLRPVVRCVIRCSFIALVVLVPGAGASASASASASANTSASTSAASSPPVSSWRMEDPRWMQGQVNVDAPPDVVFERLQHVETWPQLLSDIRRFRVTDRRGSRWKIELETRTLPYGMLPYTVEVQDDRQLRVWAKAPGVKVVAYTLVRPGLDRETSNVVYSFYLEVSGVPKLLISDTTLRKKQQHMVDVTLGDIWRAYATR